jgi:hypothetical protein
MSPNMPTIPLSINLILSCLALACNLFLPMIPLATNLEKLSSLENEQSWEIDAAQTWAPSLTGGRSETRFLQHAPATGHQAAA